MNREMRKNKILMYVGGMTLFALIMLMICNDTTKASVLSGISNNNIGYTSILYNSENGLPTSEANTIVQTSDGFIWIGGYSGLICYDGNTFHRFDSTTGITSVECLFVDTKDRLWIGTNDKGIALYEDGNFIFFGKEHGMESGSIRKIVEDERGNILIATTAGLAYIDSNLQVHEVNDHHISKKYIRDMDGNLDGDIVGITLDGDIFVVHDLKVKNFYESTRLKFPKVRSVNFNSKSSGTIYFGTEKNSIVQMELAKGIDQYLIILVEPLESINKVVRIPSGELWICADNGMGYLKNDGHFVFVNGVAMNNSIDNMMIDYEGNLWFSSSRQGVMKIVANRFNNISLRAGLPEMVVNTTCMYHGNLYIGSDTGLYVLNEKNQSIQNELTTRLTGIRIRCIIKDSKGSLWVCTYGDNGLLKYDQNGKIISFNKSNGLNSNRVRSIIEGYNGDMIVSNSGGINIIRNDKIIDSFDSKDGIVNTEILTVCEGDNGILYAGSDGGGIYVIDNGKVSCINESNGLESDVILRIKKDYKRRGYWIITSNSIAYMKNGTIKTIKSFPSSNNFDMFFSKTNDIWILSGTGIYVVNEENLLSGTELKYTLYDINDGMPSNVTSNSRSYIDDNGNLYISGSSNVFITNINQSNHFSNKMKLAVPYVEIDNKVIYLKNNQKLLIPSDCKRLTIHGFVLTYALQDPNVEYCLEGFDDKSIKTTKSEFGKVSYTNLKGGNYSFHLVVRNGDESINNELKINIEKTRTFWESTWFIVVIITVLILIILFAAFIVVKIRNKVLIKEHKRTKMLFQQGISAFAKTIDGKDKYTNGHSFRVAEYATLIAKELGYKPEQIEEIHNIALLHDIGKIIIPDAILKKTEKLTDEEFEQMKEHTSLGYEILSEITIFPEISLGARYHHEKIDGTGYPLRLKGEEIPYIARIIAVADTFDAMYSTRPYRKKLSIDFVINELKRVAGVQLDENIVDVMIKLIRNGKIQTQEVN